MAACPTCNGWGIVLRIYTPPPTTVEKRKVYLKDPKSLILREQICTACGAYGQRPDPAPRRR